MNKEFKQKWIDALRTGKYQQGRGVLRTDNNCFCCLGVLCDLVDPNGWRSANLIETSVEGTDVSQEAHPFYVGEIGSAVSLPSTLRERLGLHIADVSALIRMNDSGMPFESIAKHIEANVY